MSYQWIVGLGPSAEAIARMRAYFPRPPVPFDDDSLYDVDRSYFRASFEQLVAAFSSRGLQRYVSAMASVLRAPGHGREWDEWFRYLLPDLIERAHEPSFYPLLEELITAFFLA